MIRDEAGMLVGYVYVDMDASRKDVGGYVEEAKRAVARDVKLPAGTFLKWTGQYELLEQMQERMRVLVPVTLLLVVFLLMANFGRLAPAPRYSTVKGLVVFGAPHRLTRDLSFPWPFSWPPC